MGDPSGIGPEVTIKALASPKVRGLANFLIVGDDFVLDRIKRRLGLKVKTPIIDLANVSRSTFSFGRARPAFGRASIEYIDKALELLQYGGADALVTAPVNKASVRSSGISNFQGHTEYLAGRTGTKDFAMMFVGDSLRVALVTRHIALKDVSKNLSVDRIYKTIVLAHRYLREFFKINNPKIGVAGLNPHAGESGAFGGEDGGIIRPAIEAASRYFSSIRGPIPPDVIFHECMNKKFDAIIAMYHDQAVNPFKMLYFKNGVNLTLGLPFIRTSPDHGTAFEIAGSNKADPSSMIEAVKLACKLADAR